MNAKIRPPAEQRRPSWPLFGGHFSGISYFRAYSNFMGETRRMHYVPRTYMEKFAVAKGDQYYIAALPKAGGTIFHPNLVNVCTEKDLYLLPGETEEQRQLLEKMYSDLYEVGYNTIYKILTDKAKETVTAGEHYAIIGFVVSMFYRNNSWHNFHNHVTDEMIQRAYTLTKEQGTASFFFEEKEISIAGKSLEELQKEMKIENRPAISLVTAQTIFKLIRLRTLTDIVTVVEAQPGHEFLTSDNPVWYKAADIKQRPIPFDPTNTLAIPIDGQHLLQLQPWRDHFPWEMLGRSLEPLPGAVTSVNNHFQAHQCSRFLLGKELGLKAFQAKPSGIFPPHQ